ncbi:hypothetical protein DXG01_001421 [Tephrocybe rancida]|nr:hypothetical protein DXG01_001421 [Tephrocybe rancida]
MVLEPIPNALGPEPALIVAKASCAPVMRALPLIVMKKPVWMHRWVAGVATTTMGIVVVILTGAVTRDGEIDQASASDDVSRTELGDDMEKPALAAVETPLTTSSSMAMNLPDVVTTAPTTLSSSEAGWTTVKRRNRRSHPAAPAPVPTTAAAPSATSGSLASLREVARVRAERDRDLRERWETDQAANAAVKEKERTAEMKVEKKREREGGGKGRQKEKEREATEEERAKAANVEKERAASESQAGKERQRDAAKEEKARRDSEGKKN